jgi:hypothetical protein
MHTETYNSHKLMTTGRKSNVFMYEFTEDGMSNESFTHLACLQRFQWLCRHFKVKDLELTDIPFVPYNSCQFLIC